MPASKSANGSASLTAPYGAADSPCDGAAGGGAAKKSAGSDAGAEGVEARYGWLGLGKMSANPIATGGGAGGNKDDGA